ncbi:hypothetical protein GCM10010470_59090 [Saccharopolyspora taberi]|uniref:Uncharacterized protein n=1 Tax=Saccharopolyspora taberi TaxID=60895 RepID=A0ABN3VL23_9PSEU
MTPFHGLRIDTDCLRDLPGPPEEVSATMPIFVTVQPDEKTNAECLIHATGTPMLAVHDPAASVMFTAGQSAEAAQHAAHRQFPQQAANAPAPPTPGAARIPRRAPAAHSRPTPPPNALAPTSPEAPRSTTYRARAETGG